MKAHPEQMFLFRLARELGMTKSRLLAETNSRELTEWMAFFTIEEEERKRPKQPDSKTLSEQIKAVMGGSKHGRKKSR